MPEKYYSFPIWTDTRIRHYHRTEEGRVKEFTVQLEIEVEGIWKTVIRYDTAHGFAHVDKFNLKGEQKKERYNLSYAQVLTKAEREIKQNWLLYRERFLKGDFP